MVCPHSPSLRDRDLDLDYDMDGQPLGCWVRILPSLATMRGAMSQSPSFGQRGDPDPACVRVCLARNDIASLREIQLVPDSIQYMARVVTSVLTLP